MLDTNPSNTLRASFSGGEKGVELPIPAPSTVRKILASWPEDTVDAFQRSVLFEADLINPKRK